MTQTRGQIIEFNVLKNKTKSSLKVGG